MQIDPNLFPSTIDALHIGLAALVVVLSALLIVFISASVLSLRRRQGKPAPLTVTVEKFPPGGLAESLPQPIRVAIEKVPVEMLAARSADSAPAMAKSMPAQEPAVPAPVHAATPEAALQLLGLLQKEARFLDFVAENVSSYKDSEIGAAARVVHDGCRKVIDQYFVLEPVRSEAENSKLTLPKGFDATRVRVSGNIVGEPPFKGVLIHRGWRAAGVSLPKIAEGHDVGILAPAEVEL